MAKASGGIERRLWSDAITLYKKGAVHKARWSKGILRKRQRSTLSKRFPMRHSSTVGLLDFITTGCKNTIPGVFHLICTDDTIQCGSSYICIVVFIIVLDWVSQSLVGLVSRQALASIYKVCAMHPQTHFDCTYDQNPMKLINKQDDILSLNLSVIGFASLNPLLMIVLPVLGGITVCNRHVLAWNLTTNVRWHLATSAPISMTRVKIFLILQILRFLTWNIFLQQDLFH